MKALLRTLRYLKPYAFITCLALIALLISTVVNLLVPQLSQRVIDLGIAQKRMDVVIQMALGIVGLALVRSLFSFWQGVLTAKVSQGVAFDMRNQLYEKIQRLSFGYHDQAQTGQLLTRVTSDVELVHHFLGMAVLQIASALLMIVGSVALMIRTSPQTALVLLGVIPVAVGIFVFFFSRTRQLFVEIQQRIAALNVTLQENLAGVRVVRAFVRRVFETERFEARNQAVMDLGIRLGRIIAFAMPLIFLIANLASLGVTWVGGIQVINDRMTVGELVAFTNYVLMAIFPVFMLSFLMASVSQAAAGAERIFEVLDTQTAIVEKPDAQALPSLRGRVVFEEVWFRYFDSQPWVLENVSFVAEPGQKIALLGATGSGKSSITNLIPRFYEATQGRITLDGYDVRDVTLESLRQQVGMVLQETLLFAGTIHENIAFGKPSATRDEVIAAARAAQAHEFISEFPEAYETRVGERGVTLSGGQKQRIAIARALLVNPRILILDDATSAVDFQTELKLRQALETLMHGEPGSPGRTSFIIAQRVSTVRDADLILLLDKGRVVAQGTHAQLLEEVPLYAEIYYGQLEGNETREDRLIYDQAYADALAGAPAQEVAR